MGDIVERLRATADDYPAYLIALELEAAETILSLRQQVEANGVHADAPRERSAIETAPESAPLDGRFNALREFARTIIEECVWGYVSEPDGGDVQELAETLGLIVPHIATAEDAEGQAEFDPGDTIYRFAEWLNTRAQRKASDVSEPVNSKGVTPESIRQQIEKARALEREACAVVADDQDECAHLMATKIAELIRARNGSSPTPEK